MDLAGMRCAGAGEVREQVHSSMYRNLRTNLPREVMSYTDFPFTRTWLDSRRFCSHQEVHLLSSGSAPDLPSVCNMHPTCM